MKISFLVTYYNQERYVRDSIESILSIEKNIDWEILVGDDGSTDNTVGVVDEYIIKYPDKIKLYSMPRNSDEKYYPVKRASDNRLNLLKHASGDYFCILDGDDYYCDTSFVSKATSVFDRFPDVSVVIFGFRTDDAESDNVDKDFDTGKIENSIYIRSKYVPSSACVFRKSFSLERIQYISEIGFYDDNDIIFNNLNYGCAFCFSDVIFVYRQHNDSIYHSMTAMEQAVLNTQGHDVDSCYVGARFGLDLLERNFASILKMYIQRSKIKSVIGTDKYLYYLSTSKSIPNSICYSLLNYELLSVHEKKALKKRISLIKKRHIKFYLKEKIKFLLGKQN